MNHGGFGDDFGQKVDLTASIRNILRNYPEGTAILKELVQNADDAGARTVRFCLDRRQHGMTHLADLALAQFQGPSLLVYNSAVFTEEDFKSIQRIGDSLKNSEETSKTKIGRFGIGFNAVYHWTELPSFVSDRYLVMLDPQARFLPNVNPSNPGKIVDWIKSPDTLRTYADQFAPYLLPGMDWKKSFNGTLFRLPLRTAQQAETSYLSKRAIDEHSVADIIQSLIREASTMLLFLRNVEKIEIQEWAADATAPQTIYSCEIHSPSAALRAKRSFDAVLGRNRGTNIDPSRIICEDYTLDLLIASSLPGIPTDTEKWEICTQFGGANATAIARDSRNAHLKLVPLAGTAACVRTTGNAEFDELRRGIAYCFLPLPIKTSLPIMVNGFFELSSNRRDIWQSGGDMTGDGHTRAHWNLALLTDVVSPCYARLLMRLRDILGFNSQFQGLWPSASVPAPWDLVTKTTLSLCKTQRLLSINRPNEKEMWIDPQSAVLVPLSEDDSNALDELYPVLDHFRAPVIRFESKDLHNTLIKTKTCPITATPQYLRNLTRTHQAESLPVAMCKFVLQYCLSDQSVNNLSKALDDLKILPLLDQSVGHLKIFDSTQVDTLQQLIGMGFPLQESMSALQQSNFDLMRACELLSDTSSRQRLLGQRRCFFLADKDELQVFRDASSVLIDIDSIRPNELEFIAHNKFQALSNVRKFQASLVRDLLAQIMPVACMEGKLISIASLPAADVPKLQSFVLQFWKYAALKPAVLANVVQSVSLLPTVNFEKLLPISRISNVIVPRKGEQALPVDIEQLLQSLQISLASVEHMGCDLNAMPSVFWEYVHPPTRKGVLAVISFRTREGSSAALFEVDANMRTALRQYLAQGLVDFNDEDFSTISKLPIFPIFNQDGGEEPVHVALHDKNRTPSQFITLKDFSSIPQLWFPEHLVFHQTMQEFQLLTKLKVRNISKAAFFAQLVLPRAAQLFENTRMLYEESVIHVLLDMQQHMRDDKDFIHLLKSSRFIPTASSSSPTLCSAAELFDPTDKDMVSLLDERYLPAESFRAEEVLVLLRSLGLKTIIDWEGIIASARSVASIDDANVEQKLNKGYNLLTYLDKNIHRLLGEDKKPKQSTGFSLFSSISSLFQEQSQPELSPEALQRYQVTLCEIEWVPVQLTPSHSFMPWVQSATPCAAPKVCAPAADIWLCSAKKRIVTEPVRSEGLRCMFCWDRPVVDVIILQQLVAISQNFSALEEQHRGEANAANSEPTTTTQDLVSFRQIITGLIPQIYRRLDTSHEKSTIRAHLANVPWIWMGHHFISAQRTALNSSVNAAPYLYQVPEELKVYPNLLANFNIKAQFSFRDYISALADMARERGVTTAEIGEPLTDSLLDVAISLVTLVSAENASTLQAHDIFVPDNTGRLAVARDLMHDDVPWLEGPQYIGMRSTSRFVHSNISSKVAEKLGVRSLRVSLVNTNLEQTPFGDNVESFGQAESLTNRLKTILDLYPDGSPILNELIQNADDAGATVIRILIDENSYGKESLMDSRMEELQGPSLLIQNDACFSKADFQNLASVGQASKLEKLATTGRFGLGFNSTYHLTDTPMFVSGDYFVFFDPHRLYVPGTTANQPGIRIKFTGTDLSKIFSNQFEPFMQYGCDCEHTYNGTLFRFPLRTATQAKKSEICKRSYRLSDLDSIVNQLVEQLSTVALFLRSIRAIEIYRKAEGSSEPTLVHSVNITIASKSTENDQSLMAFFDKSSSSVPMSKEAFYNNLMTVPDDHLPVAYVCKNVLLTSTRGGVSTAEQSEYLVVQGLRGGRAKKLACSESARDLKLIPFGGVSACISRQRTDIQQEKTILPLDTGRVFCFLPTPITSSLHVHINAYWELSSNRRDIWRGEDTKGDAKLRSDWNQYLMEDVLAPLYCKLLVHLNETVVRKSSDIPRNIVYDLLPSPLPPQPWDGLARALFRALKNQHLLWTNLQGGQSLKCSEAYLLQKNDRRLESKEVENLENLLLREGVPVVSIDKELMSCFLEASSVAGVVDSSFIRKIFHISNNRRHPVLECSDNTLESWLKVIDNALFLLFFALLDVKQVDGVPNYEEMLGLKLIPLENHSIGALLNPLDHSSFYMCSDTERVILDQCKDKLLVSSSLIRNDVLKHFEHPEFARVCNLQALQSVDVLKLLCSIVPKQWTDCNTTVVPRTHHHMNERWFHFLWKYILDKKLVDLFADVFPLVPVHPSRALTAGSASPAGLAKVSKRVPILSLSQRANVIEFNAIVEGLAALGAFVLDETAAAEYTHHPEFKKLIFEDTASGILQTLKNCEANISQGASQWSKTIRLAMRKFVLGSVVAKVNRLDAAEQSLLCQLPIWLTLSPKNKHVAVLTKNIPSLDASCVSSLEFSTLSDANSLGPMVVSLSLLDSKYIWIENDQEAAQFAKMGLKQLTLGEFFASDVLEGVLQSRFSREELQSVGDIALVRLKTLESDQPGITKAVGSCSLFSNAKGELCAANHMYDPNTTMLTAVLPAAYFPHADYLKDPVRLVALQTLGLRTVIDCEGIVAATKSIEDDQRMMLGQVEANVISSSSNQPLPSIENHASFKPVLERSKGLLRYLETNIESLLLECDSQGLKNWKEKQANSSTVTAASTPLETEESLSPSQRVTKLGGQWANELRSTWWVSVFTQVPDSYKHKGLPWPRRMHSSPFAAPSQTTVLSNAWFSSSSLRVCTSDVQSPLLLAVLGWDAPLPGSHVALQLASMSAEFQALSDAPTVGNPNLSLPSIRSSYNEVFPSLINKLNACFEGESELTIAHWMNSIKNKPVIWVSQEGKFVEASRFAMKSSLSISTEPFLFVVPPYLMRFERLLVTLGVKESFQAKDLANLTVQIYQSVGPQQALSSERAAIQIGIIAVMFELLQAEANATSPTTNTAITSDSVADEGSAPEETGLSVPTSEEATPLNKITREQVLSLGAVYVPDTHNVLCLSTSVFFNDAPWISPTTINERFRALRFVNNRLDNERCELLGCKSLRELLFAGEDVVCPSAHQLNAFIEEDGVRDVLRDLLYLADHKRCETMEVIYDDNSYPCESLLHPGLAATQGPSLLVHWPECVLSCEEICKLLVEPTFISPETGKAIKINSQSGEMSPALGKHLLSCFSVSDCLQILSGSEMFVFDPCGAFLHQERHTASIDNNSSAVTGAPQQQPAPPRRLLAKKHQRHLETKECSPKAQRYKLDGKRDKTTNSSGRVASAQDQNLLESFRDQFSPFFSISESVRSQLSAQKTYRGTIIRLPLRHASSALSRSLFSLKEIKVALGSVKHIFSASLVFARSLRTLSISRCTADVPRTLSFSISLHSSLQDRNARLKLQQATGWDRQGLMKLVTSFVPPEHAGIVKLMVRVGDVSWLAMNRTMKLLCEHLYSSQRSTYEEVFYVHACMGCRPLRDHALNDPFRGLKLLPYVAIATQQFAKHELLRTDIAPDPGLRVCEGCVTETTGLPFHIESMFIQTTAPMAMTAGRRASSSQALTAATNANTNRPVDYGQQWNSAVFTTAIHHLYPKVLMQLQQSLVNTCSSKKELEGFYKYWAFYPRLHPSLKAVIKSTNELHQLATTQALFLSNGAFAKLNDVVMPLHELPAETCSYLSSSLALASSPTQMTLDLREHHTHLVDLSPDRLRGFLKREFSLHARELTRVDRRSVLFSLLAYTLRDLRESVSGGEEGEFVLKRNFKKLAGVPLLLTADERVKCFASNANERKALMPPPVCRAFLPSDLLAYLIAPEVSVQFASFFENALFQEALFLSPFNAVFLRHVINLLLPPMWLMHKAIAWIARNNSNAPVPGYRSVQQLEKLLFSLWNNVLRNESALSLSALHDFPLLPVCVQGVRVLIPVEAMKHIFVAFPNASEDRYRRALKMEIDIAAKEATERSTATNIAAAGAQGDTQEDWDWTQRRATEEDMLQEEEMITAGEREGEREESSVAVDANVAAENALSSADVDVSVDISSPVPTSDSPNDAQESDEAATDATQLSVGMYTVLQQLGVPFLDGLLFEGMPSVVRAARSETHAGRQIVEALHYFNEKEFTVFDAFATSGNAHAHNSVRFVDFQSLSPTQRNVLLVEIFNAHRTESFSDGLLEKVKSLSLFTNSFDESTPVAIKECSDGVYFCGDEQVLQTLRGREHGQRTFSSPSASALSTQSQSQQQREAQPVVLVSSPELREIYRWLQIEELTAALAMTRFILPTMSAMSCAERVQLVQRLSLNWGTYKSDQTLVNALKAVPFIPMWTMSAPEDWQRVRDEREPPLEMRRCEELLLWTNDELMGSLRGDALPKYYCPPSLRTPELLAVFSDLGMSSELKEQTFLAVVNDIQSAVESAHRERDDAQLHSCRERGRRILRYILSANRADSLFNNNSFARTVGKIVFVPMRSPVSMEEGGFVVFKDDVGSFDQFISKQHGMTAFSVLPILEDDIVPPTMFFSSLGIVNAPQKEVVLRHMRNLIKAQHLERWNSSHYTAEQTFHALFQFLADNWRLLSDSITKSLRQEAIIPVGNLLVPPNRIFFRLTEDLAPFMHELPRQFGAHEKFLSTIGVRESPGSMDYVHFLRDLSQELGAGALNPNELRAIVTISQTIAQQLEHISSSSASSAAAEEAQLLVPLSAPRKKMFVPDEHSVMRYIDQCIINDDSSLRSKIGARLENMGLFALHPSLNTTDFGRIMHLHTLSSLFREHVDVSRLQCAAQESVWREKVLSVFSDATFLRALSALVRCELERKWKAISASSSSSTSSLNSMMDTSSLPTESSIHHQLTSVLALRFVESLSTSLVMRNPVTQQEKTLSSSSADSLSAESPVCYLHKTDNQLVINARRIGPNGLSLELAVSLGLCQFFSLDRIFASMIAELMTAEPAIRSFLVQAYNLQDDFQSAQILLRGCPGARLTATDTQLLELRPMRIYRTEEIVAYEDVDVNTQNDNNNSANSKQFFYGKIVRVGEANELGVRKLDVKTGRGVQKLLSTEVYAFSSARGREKTTSAATFASALYFFSQSNTNTPQASLPSQENAPSAAAAQPAEGGNVISQKELLTALQGLLHRAGLPTSLDQEEMMSRILDLEGQNSRAEEQLKTEKQQQAQLREALEQQVESFKCTICIAKNVDHVLVPCGHTFCEDCVKQLRHNRCHYCRANVQAKVKMYIGPNAS